MSGFVPGFRLAAVAFCAIFAAGILGVAFAPNPDTADAQPEPPTNWRDCYERAWDGFPAITHQGDVGRLIYELHVCDREFPGVEP